MKPACIYRLLFEWLSVLFWVLGLGHSLSTTMVTLLLYCSCKCVFCKAGLEMFTFSLQYHHPFGVMYTENPLLLQVFRQASLLFPDDLSCSSLSNASLSLLAPSSNEIAVNLHRYNACLKMLQNTTTAPHSCATYLIAAFDMLITTISARANLTTTYLFRLFCVTAHDSCIFHHVIGAMISHSPLPHKPLPFHSMRTWYWIILSSSAAIAILLRPTL